VVGWSVGSRSRRAGRARLQGEDDDRGRCGAATPQVSAVSPRRRFRRSGERAIGRVRCGAVRCLASDTTRRDTEHGDSAEIEARVRRQGWMLYCRSVYNTGERGCSYTDRIPQLVLLVAATSCCAVRGAILEASSVLRGVAVWDWDLIHADVARPAPVGHSSSHALPAGAGVATSGWGPVSRQTDAVRCRGQGTAPRLRQRAGRWPWILAECSLRTGVVRPPPLFFASSVASPRASVVVIVALWFTFRRRPCFGRFASLCRRVPWRLA
jgi:hypothetical protein